MKKTIVKESVFGLYHKDEKNGMTFLGEHRVSGRVPSLKKSEIKELFKTIKGLNKIVFDKYEIELREMSEEDFIKYSKPVVTK